MPSYTILDNIAETFLSSYIFLWNTIYSFYNEYSRAILDYIHIFFEQAFTLILLITAVLASFYLLMAAVAVSKKKKQSAKVEEGKEPTVTVQIPTYNELAALNCAKRCLEFDYPKDKLQIIIGDDSNDRSVSAKIDAFASGHDNILVTRRGKNIGFKPGNLNHMLNYTTGEIIVIFDSDFLPKKNFLRSLVAPFVKDENVSVVQAKWNIVNFKQNVYSVLGGTISLLCHNIALSFMTSIGGNSFLCGSAEAIRKKHLDEVGGWLMGSLTEDVECSMRLMKNGRKLVYLEDVECECEAPYTFKDLYKQQMRWGYGVISAMKMHAFSVFMSRKTKIQDKLSVLIFISGYMFSMLLLAITLCGLLSILSHRPAPIEWGLFLSETTRNIAMTSGFLISSIIALALGKKLKHVPKMLAGSLSIGLAVTYYVNVGIFKALFGRGMQWFMLNKNGNKVAE